MQQRIRASSSLQEIILNTSWLFGDRILRMGVGVIVGIWVARYLGPEMFGLLNYATAFVALFGVLATLGLNSIVVRDLVQNSESTNEVLGTSFILQLFGGLLAYVLVVLVIYFAKPEDELARTVVIILGFSLVFRCFDTVRYWFESRVQSKYIVWVENGIFLFLALTQGVLVLLQAPFMAFVWVNFANAILVATGLLYVYTLYAGSVTSWGIDLRYARALLKEGWPLLLSGIAIMVYMRIDQIMLGQMLGNEAVGIYSVAIRMSEVWYFIPVAIVASVFPAVIKAKEKSTGLYQKRLQNLYDLMVLVGLSVAIPMSFVAGYLIVMLFGKDYVAAGTVLAIHIWAGVFVSLSVVNTKWLILDGFQKNIFYMALFGAVINVAANWLLIPLLGINGAALGTVLSQFIALFSVVFHSGTKVSASRMGKSFVLNKTFIRMLRA